MVINSILFNKSSRTNGRQGERRSKRKISFRYLMNEMFVRLVGSEQLAEYLFTACGQDIETDYGFAGRISLPIRRLTGTIRKYR